MSGQEKQELKKKEQVQQQQKIIINQGEQQQFVNLPNDYPFNTLIYYKPKQTILGNQLIKIAMPQKQNNSPIKNKHDQTDGKWLTYLKQSYEHYCKSTYRTGKNTTFDRIKSTSTLMNPSTFVAFCRDFGIKIQLVQLMNIFKKVTGFQSFMRFDQFFSAIVAISQILYAQQINNSNQNQFMQQVQSKGTIKNQIKSPQTNKQIKQNSQTFKKLLKYLHMHNGISFRRKMLQIDKRSRNHGVNPYENLIKMKPLSQYKFKVTALNGKNPQDVKQQLSIRRQIKQEKKQKIKQKKIQKQIQAVKLAQINKLSPNYKKIIPGGYMSPSLNNNNSKITQGNKLNDSKLTKNVSIINKTNLNIDTQFEQSNKNSINLKNKRFHTQFNSYQTSFDVSQYITDRERTSNQADKKQTIKNKQQTNNKVVGYLKKFRQKAIKNIQKNKDRYGLNSVLKQAKHQSDTNNYRQSIFASKQVYDHIRRAVNVSRNSDSVKMNNKNHAQNETKQIKNREFKADTRPISIYDKAAIKNLLVDLDQEDQYLGKLTNYSRSKRRMPSQF